jgi:single-strand DNA-binding protein
MNQITLIGRLTHDPELVHRSEKTICQMRLAVDGGRHPTTYIDVRAFDDQAYACAEYLSKGNRIGVNGRLIYDEWRGPDGAQRYRYSVIGRVEFLDGPPRDPGQQPTTSEPEQVGDREPEGPARVPVAA